MFWPLVVGHLAWLSAWLTANPYLIARLLAPLTLSGMIHSQLQTASYAWLVAKKGHKQAHKAKSARGNS